MLNGVFTFAAGTPAHGIRADDRAVRSSRRAGRCRSAGGDGPADEGRRARFAAGGRGGHAGRARSRGARDDGKAAAASRATGAAPDDASGTDFSTAPTALADRQKLEQEEQQLEASLADKGVGSGETRRALATDVSEVRDALAAPMRRWSSTSPTTATRAVSASSRPTARS